MPQKTSSVITEDVIRKYLYGMKQDEIAKTASTSEANVSNIIREFKTGIDQKDIEVGVTLMRVLNAKNISHVQIIPTIRTYSIMQQLGLDIDDKSTDEFLSGFYKEAKSNGIEPKILVKTAIMVHKLKPRDMPLENIPKYYEDLLTKIKSKEEKLVELEKDLAQKGEQKIRADKELQTKLEETKTTLGTLEEYHTNKKSLESMGVSIDDISKISNIFKQVSALGYDVSKIIEYTSKEGAFEQRQLQLEENIGRLSKQEKLLEKKREELENTIEVIKSEIEELEKIAGQLRDSINLIRHLEKQGIDPVQIIQWNKILKLSGIQLQQFKDDLQKFNGITGYIENKKAELQALEKEIVNKRSRVKTLVNEQIRLESIIDEKIKVTFRYLEEAQKQTITLISNTELSSTESIRSMADKIKEEFRKVSNSKQEDMERLFSSVSDLISQISIASEEIGRMDVLRSLCNILSKSEGNPCEVYPSMISLLQKFKTWLEHHKADRSTINLTDNLITYLKNEDDKTGIHA